MRFHQRALGSGTRFGKVVSMDKLRQRRLNVGLTQHQLAAKSGIAQQTISFIECRGHKRSPHKFVLRAIEAALWTAENEKDEKDRQTAA